MKVMAYPPKRMLAVPSSPESFRAPVPRQSRHSLQSLLEALGEHVRSADFASLFEVRDVLALAGVCRSFHQIFNTKYIQLVIRLGNLESRLRYLFWISQAPYIKYEGDTICI